jgi:hypothetical protein
MAEAERAERLALEAGQTGQLALQAPVVPVEVDIEPEPGARGRFQITEDERAQLMNEMAPNERNPDPSRETSYMANTDYRMDNGLVLRFHDAPSAIWIELRTPPRAGDQGTTLGILARLQNPRAAPDGAVAKRWRIYELAKRLQPSSMQALAAIRDTVETDARQQGLPAGMTPPATPRPGAPSTPFPYPMTGGLPGMPPARLEPAALGTMSKAGPAAKPKVAPVAWHGQQPG